MNRDGSVRLQQQQIEQQRRQKQRLMAPPNVLPNADNLPVSFSSSFFFKLYFILFFFLFVDSFPQEHRLNLINVQMFNWILKNL